MELTATMVPNVFNLTIVEVREKQVSIHVSPRFVRVLGDAWTLNSEVSFRGDREKVRLGNVYKQVCDCAHLVTAAATTIVHGISSRSSTSLAISGCFIDVREVLVKTSALLFKGC